MTTAHRPTWHSVRGGSEQGGNSLVTPTRQYSSRDLPAHLHLKERKPGQGTIDEVEAMNYKQDLLKREREFLETKFS